MLTTALWIHIAAGSVALLSAVLALITAKGKTRHAQAGRIYALAMTIIFLTAVPLAVFDRDGFNPFLLLIAFFSFYLVFAGWRFARNRTRRPHPADWAAIALLGLAGLGMWGYGAVLGQEGDSQWITLAAFGAIALALGVVDAHFHWKQPRGPRRIARHLTNMLAGTIATLTAVTVVNVDIGPDSPVPVWLPWILPTVMVTPLIVWWNRRLRRPKASIPRE